MFCCEWASAAEAYGLYMGWFVREISGTSEIYSVGVWVTKDWVANGGNELDVNKNGG